MTATSFAEWTATGSDVLHLAEPVRVVSGHGRVYGGDRRREIWWEGPANGTAIQLIGCHQVGFRNLTVVPQTDGVSAFDLTAEPGGTNSSGCRFDAVTVEYRGTGSFKHGYRIDVGIGGGAGRGNDCMDFRYCTVNGVTESMWFITQNQSMLHSFYRCGGDGMYRTKHCIDSISTHTIRVTGGGGANLTGYAYKFGVLGSGFGEIDGAVWETCRGGLFSLPGGNVTGVLFSIRGCRYNQVGIVTVPTVHFGPQVPAVSIERNGFESWRDELGRWSPCSIRVEASRWTTRRIASATISQNAFDQPAIVPPARIEVSQFIPDAGLQAVGNQLWVGGVATDVLRPVRVP